jgi:hypothetical protein
MPILSVLFSWRLQTARRGDAPITQSIFNVCRKIALFVFVPVSSVNCNANAESNQHAHNHPQGDVAYGSANRKADSEPCPDAGTGPSATLCY